MDMFEVVVGKRSSSSDTEDDDFQKSIKVSSYTVHYSIARTSFNQYRLN
jgi:hypothetical protein